MYVVIFRAKIRELDAEYGTTAARLRDTALRDFGCTEFIAATEGDEEIALSYWPDTASIARWKAHLDHRAAQEAGRTRWYRSYRIEVTRIERAYGGGAKAPQKVPAPE